MTRVLLFGKDGQLGRALDRTEILGGDRAALGRAECDLAEEGALRDTVRRNAPAVIVNAAAYTAVDRAEDERDVAFAVNTAAPGVLAEEAREAGSLLVHFSTDYVFDGGKADAYVETDPTGPLNVYGESKLAGEQAITASGCIHVILRTSWVFSATGANFATTMLRLARERDRLAVVADQQGTPTPVDLLADIVRRFVDRFSAAPDPALVGLYHCAPRGSTNWRDFAVYFLSCCVRDGISVKLDPAAIAPITTEAYAAKARRPKNSLLSCRKLEQTLGITLPDWRDGVERVAAQLAKAQ